MNYNVAIVGATGMVGRKFIEVLQQRNFPVNNMYFYAFKKSAGSILHFKECDITVEELCEENIKNKKIDFALFSAGGDVSKNFAPVFAFMVQPLLITAVHGGWILQYPL